GQPNVCGGNTGCMPRSCAAMGADCGPLADGCGGLLMCGSCPSGQSCGIGGKPNVCGSGTQSTDMAGMTCVPKTRAQLGLNCGAPTPDGGTCTNLCLQQASCDGGSTTLTGTVVAPTPSQYGAPDPIYGATVYVPNSPVSPFPAGVSCDQCGTPVSGSPLVIA